MSVNKILKATLSGEFKQGERKSWLAMAWGSQVVVLGLITGLLNYDLIVLEKL